MVCEKGTFAAIAGAGIAATLQCFDAVVATVEELGSMADGDKLKVHIKELESVTRLLTVLKVRLETAENKLKIARDVEKVIQT